MIRTSYERAQLADARLKARVAELLARMPATSETERVELLSMALGIVLLGYPFGLALFNPRAAPWISAAGGLLLLALAGALASQRQATKQFSPGSAVDEGESPEESKIPNNFQ